MAPWAGVLKNQSNSSWFRSHWAGQKFPTLQSLLRGSCGFIYKTPMFFVVLGIESRISCMLDKCSTTELKSGFLCGRTGRRKLVW